MTRSEGDLLEAPVPTARSRSGRGGDDQLATVRTVMALMAATTCAQVCTLLWQPRSGGLRVLDVGATTTRVGDHRAWLRRATTLTPGSVVQADDGVRLAPVHSSDGWFL